MISFKSVSLNTDLRAAQNVCFPRETGNREPLEPTKSVFVACLCVYVCALVLSKPCMSRGVAPLWRRGHRGACETRWEGNGGNKAGCSRSSGSSSTDVRLVSRDVGVQGLKGNQVEETVISDI